MKVVILCGGKGTRSYPFTEYYPKVMMPIGGVPIIVHLMKIFAQQGLSEFVLAAGHRKEILTDYFEDRFREWEVDIIDTGEESDTGERVRRCRHLLEDTFMVTYGDGLGNINMDELMRFHGEHSGMATVTTVPLRSQYGTVVFNGRGQVEEFIEKPVIDSFWINAGFFVLDPVVFDHWEGHNLERDVLPALARRGDSTPTGTEASGSRWTPARISRRWTAFMPRIRRMLRGTVWIRRWRRRADPCPRKSPHRSGKGDPSSSPAQAGCWGAGWSAICSSSMRTSSLWCAMPFPAPC